MTSLKYDKYPECCPPATAEPIEGCFYRLCDNNPPTPQDFLTHIDLGKTNFSEAKLCEAHALSFFDTIEAAKKLQNRFPKFKEQLIVKILILKNHGRGEIKNGHLNLWEFRGADFCNSLEIEENE